MISVVGTHYKKKHVRSSFEGRFLERIDRWFLKIKMAATQSVVILTIQVNFSAVYIVICDFIEDD